MLLASLVECLTILPMHLAHKSSLIFKVLHAVFFLFAWLLPVARECNHATSAVLDWYVRRIYTPTLRLALKNRLTFVCGCIAVFIATLGLIRSGVTPFVFFSKLDANTLLASVKFPDGTPEQATDRWTKHIEEAF